MPTLRLLRRCLLAILTIGLVGSEVELLLLKHTDGIWQLVPVILIALGLVAVVWVGIAGSTTSIRGLQLMMWLFVASGIVGVIQHYRGNVSYERDSNPSLAGMDLYKSALMGSSPALAPGTMIQLGLVGLLFAFRHPGLVGHKSDEA